MLRGKSLIVEKCYFNKEVHGDSKRNELVVIGGKNMGSRSSGKSVDNGRLPVRGRTFNG